MIEVGRVAMVPVSKVIVREDRIREVMGDLDGMEANMKETGLITPLALKDNGNGSFTLLAGERRFTVIKRHNGDGPDSMIPARIYEHELSELEMKIIEKSENFYRKDMEYYEFDELTRQIHLMQQELHGGAVPGPNNEGWTVKQTGEMIGISQPSTSQAIARATAREAFPELFSNCKSASDATKVLKKINEQAVLQAMAQKIESQVSENDLAKIGNCYIVKDFFEGVKDIPENVFHLVEIDPPYAIKLQDVKKAEGESQYVLSNYNEMSPEEYEELMPRLFKECYRVMTEHSWLICWFAPQPWFEKIYKWIRDAGFGTTRMCGIWTKGISGQNKQPAIRLSNSYEMFFYAWKGQPALNRAGHSNEFKFPPVPPNQKTHPTERPIELMQELYDTFAFPGSRVLIPFGGSGNGVLAAHKLGMSAICYDLTRAYKDSFLVKAHAMFNK